MKEHVSAYKAARLRKKEKETKHVSAYLATKKNRGSDVGYMAKRAGIDFLRVGEGVVDAALVPIDLLTGNVEQAKSRFMDSPVDAMRERLDEEYNPGKVAGFIGDIAGGIGQSVGYGLISAIPYAGTPMMYSSIVEQSISSAAEKTGEVGLKEIGYGATAGAVEGLLESKLGAGVSAFKGIGSAILKKTGINVAESAAKAGGKSLLKTLAIDTAKGFAGEFGEEFVSEAVDPKLQNIWGIDKDARFSLKDSFRAGIIGGISGGAISIGPSAINYKSSVSVGRALQESGLDGDLIKRAKYTLSALEAAQTRSTSQKKGKPEGDTKETAKEWLSRTAENRKVKRLSRETKELADKVRNNINAYESYIKDPRMAKSEPVAALLGELRGNLFLVGYAYEADVIEQVMMNATDEQRQAFVDTVNEELAAQGKKHDYTLADFDANKDDIRRGLAGLLMADEMQGYTAEYGAEATDSPAEPAQAPKDTTAEEVNAQEENDDTEDLSGIEEEVWRAVTDETVKGYGTQNEQEVALLRAAVSQNVPEKSIPLMLERFREGTDMTPAEFADAWADGVLLFGRLGLNEKKISQESALSRMSEKARRASIEYGKYLSEEQRTKEQEAVKKKKRPVKEGASKKPKGEVVRHPEINLKADLDDAQFTAYKAAEIMAPALKADIEIHKGLKRDGKEVNGYYDLKTNTIHININAVRDGKHIALYTLGHEVTHYIKEWSPKKFYELGDYVMDQLGEGAEQAIRDKLDFLKRNDLVKGLDETEAYDRAYEEVVADGMELVLTDGTVLNELARENKTLWQKIKDRIFEIIEKIKKAYGDLSKTSRTAQILSETMDSLDDIEQLFYEGVTEAGERTRTAGVGTNTKTKRKYSVEQSRAKITVGMSDSDRTQILQSKKIIAPIYTGQADQLILVNKDDLESSQRGLVKAAIVRIGDELGVFADYNISDVDVMITLSKGNLRESISKDATPTQIAKLLPVLKQAVENAIGIESHDNRYYYDTVTVRFDNLMGGFIDGEYFVPVRFGLKQSVDGHIALYVVVDQNKIDLEKIRNKKTEVIKAASPHEVESSTSRSVSYSISQIIPFVNSVDVLRYIPDDMLTNEQKNVKYQGIADTIRYTNEKNDRKYSKYISENKLDAAKQMVRLAALANGYIFQQSETEREGIWIHSKTGQVKSGAVITYDDNGNVIPLSERFKEDDSDIRYSIDETPETPDVSDSAFDEALRRAGLSHLVEDTAETGDTETAPPSRKPPERDPEEDRLDRIRAHETLANALMDAAQNEHEFRLVKNYREKAAELADAEVRKEDLRKKTAEVNREIDALQSKLKGVEKTKREPWVMTALTDAQKRKGELLDEMDALDEKLRTETDKLLSLASAKQLRKLIRAERSKAAAMERSAERARQREMDSKEWAKETVKKAREESDEKVKKARQEAQDYKAAVYKTSMDKVYKAKREATDYKRAVYRTAYAKADEKSQKYRDRLDEMAKQSMERREITSRKRAVQRILGTLNTMLYHPNRQKHVPEELRGLTETVLASADPKKFAVNRDHIREMSDLAAKIERLERKVARTAEEQTRLEKMKSKYEHLEEETISVKRQAEALLVAFKKYQSSVTTGTGFDQALIDKMTVDVESIEEASLKEMTLESLKAVENFYTMLKHQIDEQNNLFMQGKEARVSEFGNNATTEASDAKSLKFLSPKSMELKGMANVRQFFWKNMKPLTVFEAIGSDTFTRLFQSVLNGENVWARDIEEARKKIVETRDKYGYDKWELDKRVEVKDKDGKTVRLSLSEMMSLYAYAKRKQAMGHLEGGGFVLDPGATEMAKGKVISFADMERRLNHAERHVVDQLIIGEIASKLTAEQKSYVDEMQTYLTKLGEQGNTVSRKLYGIDIFTEEYYFPIKVKSEYLESHTGRTGDPNIKNRGMTKEVTPEADNPLVLQGFDAVMVDHINSMATYHAFVLPVEDLTRVLNYKPSNAKIDEDGNWTVDESRKDYSTLKAVIEEKYGAEANHYIEQLIRDLNGGARRDAAATLLDKGITGFKRASTMASLSVLFQQPTSLIRAAAYIDTKYLFGQASMVDFANHKKLWERLCKYAPVGIIKEMGGYDTGVGARTGDYLNAKVYKTPKEKWEAFFKPERFGGDSNYRAEVFGKGAAYADKMAWIQMFEACVSEQADKLGKSRDSEDVLKAAGKRFEEVVRRTQVYDSTLTRTEFMRSKDTGMKMATAFMAEPSTVVSMVADAIMKAERGDTAFLRRTAGAVAGAVIINALASSLIYAMRDDDEEKTYGEKYVASVAMEAAEAVNPLEYLPYFRDIMSIMKGYEIERTDMTLISNLFQQVELLTNSKRTVGEKMLGVSGAVSAFFGIPMTNLTRDAKGIVNTFMGGVDTERGTAKGMSTALKEEFSGIFGLFDEQTKNEYQLYQAYVSGDTAHYERVKARYKSESAAEQALRQALRDHEPRISEAAQARLSGDLAVYESLVDQIESEGIFDRNIVIRAINNEMLDLKDEDTSKLVPKDETVTDEDETAESLYKASDLNNALERGDAEDFAAILAALVQDKVSTGKTEAQARASVKSSVTAYWKKLYVEAWSRGDTEERKRIIAILTETGLYGTRNDVATLAQNWVKNSK